MITLGSNRISASGFPSDAERMIFRVCRDSGRHMPLRCSEMFVISDGDIPEGFGAYGYFGPNPATFLSAGTPAMHLPDEFRYLEDGDIIRIEPKRNAIRVLYRRSSASNAFLMTERCNHYCLMCSQPPRDVDDGWLVDEIVSVIPMISDETKEIGLTGGEPTLLGDGFLRVVRTAKNYLPRTALHILSNGRRFSDPHFARSYAEINHHDVMIGIPIYSDLSTVHDYVVQADGAFDETIRGILNLKRNRQRVEIRIVIHKQTYSRLPQLAEFIARNLTFVDQVVLMGLEITGFTRANLPDLWIDPVEYQQELLRATQLLASHRMHVSIYNHQLCLIDRSLWPFARKSISDWKNEYMPECQGCAVMGECGGFFSSAKHQHSSHISPIVPRPE